jgi:tRNA wybutosine-synthesizing protein 1
VPQFQIKVYVGEDFNLCFWTKDAVARQIYKKPRSLFKNIDAWNDERVETSIPPQLVQALLKQKYHLVGRHSGVKRCKWLNEALVNDRHCYKQKFYGIKSHQCLQMTPSLYYCTQQCMFCWRAQKGDLQIGWDELKLPNWDPVESIVEGCLHAQKRILSGYKGNLKTDERKFREALTPRHVAISLTGEPTLYEYLGELLHAFHRKSFTTFLVTNGTRPDMLAGLGEEPTQLYVSVCASTLESYKRVCRPQENGAWSSLNETLSLLPSFRCPTVIRMTLVKGLNMENVDRYAKIVENAAPTYVEAKAYMHVGFSNLRLGYERMPEHKDVEAFAGSLAEKTGYQVLDECPSSRVVLLSKRKKAIRFDSN